MSTAAQPDRYTDVLVRQRDGHVAVLRYSNDPAHPFVRLLERLDLASARPDDDKRLQDSHPTSATQQ